MKEIISKKVHCRNCNGEKNHNILANHKRNSEYEEGLQWVDVYYIVQCAGCDTIAFVNEYGDEDMYEIINGEREWYMDVKVYPNDTSIQIEDPLSLKNFDHLPYILYQLYTQIVANFNMNYHILSLSGVRTLIEGICKELNIEGGHIYNQSKEKRTNKKGEYIYSENIQGKIFGLYEAEHITFNHCSILQKIREKSNEAIHEVAIPESAILREIIIVIEKLIHEAFELKNHILLRDQ